MKTVSPSIVAIAVGLVECPVPGATPKKPASGLMARRRPSAPCAIQAMSSPMVSTVQPGMEGRSIAKLVLPQALGNPAATWKERPSGFVALSSSMWAASQPSCSPILEAIRSANPFLARIALPP